MDAPDEFERVGGQLVSRPATATPATDGYLTITDRKKDVTITGAENVSTIELEDVLLLHEAVHKAAVIGIAD